jgi:hypothetical protein
MKHGSEADPGTSPTAAGWNCVLDGAGMPKKILKKIISLHIEITIL